MNFQQNRLLVAGALWFLAGNGFAQAPSPNPAPTTPPTVAPAAVLAAPAIPRQHVDALTQLIDSQIDRKLRSEKVVASPLATDAEFLRRIYLDLTGKVPPAEKVAAFLDDRSTVKRPRLIDDLLADPEFGRHLGDIWQRWLLPRNSENRLIAIEPFAKWLEERFNAGKPWDQIVRELLTATGVSTDNQAITYYIANRELDKITDNVSRSFLGVQLQCAQCHNHPFTDWKQDEYWGMAAFFAQVRFAGNPRMAARRGVGVMLAEGGRGRPLMPPDSAKQLPPKFLAGAVAQVPADKPLRPVLADWLTASNNPYFAKAMANRIWGQLFGRGIVNPIDDMHDGHLPSHPELLKELATQFSGHGYDIKFLYRAVCNSQTYQRTSKPIAGNAEAGPELFARMAIKPLSAEQLFDSLVTVLDFVPGQGPMGRKQQQANLRGPNANPRNFFVSFFQNEDGGEITDYQSGIPQVLRLMNGPFLNNGWRMHPAISKGGGPKEVVETLFLSALARRPSESELERLLAFLRDSREQPRQAYGDMLWVLLNSSEFVLNH